MKYYRHKEPAPVNYKNPRFQPCWTCKNACGKCSWSKNAEPVPGWIVTETYIPENTNCEKSYKIIYCPEYKAE